MGRGMQQVFHEQKVLSKPASRSGFLLVGWRQLSWIDEAMITEVICLGRSSTVPFSGIRAVPPLIYVRSGQARRRYTGSLPFWLLLCFVLFG